MTRLTRLSNVAAAVLQMFCVMIPMLISLCLQTTVMSYLSIHNSFVLLKRHWQFHQRELRSSTNNIAKTVLLCSAHT